MTPELSIVVDAALWQLSDIREGIKQGQADCMTYENLYNAISLVSANQDGTSGADLGYLDAYDTPEAVYEAESKFAPVF